VLTQSKQKRGYALAPCLDVLTRDLGLKERAAFLASIV